MVWPFVYRAKHWSFRRSEQVGTVCRLTLQYHILATWLPFFLLQGWILAQLLCGFFFLWGNQMVDCESVLSGFCCLIWIEVTIKALKLNWAASDFLKCDFYFRPREIDDVSECIFCVIVRKSWDCKLELRRAHGSGPSPGFRVSHKQQSQIFLSDF